MTAYKLLGGLKKIDPQTLTPLHRILLITDGTLTDILEAYFFEPIQLIKLSQRAFIAPTIHEQLRQDVGGELLEREILLRGNHSKKNYLYAESTIVLDHLPKPLRDELLNSNMPLGRLWLKYQLETFKNLIELECIEANDLADHFGCTRDTLVLRRTYSVLIKGQATMLISEYFPAK